VALSGLKDAVIAELNDADDDIDGADDLDEPEVESTHNDDDDEPGDEDDLLEMKEAILDVSLC
jgi:hypothetical protein